MTERIINEWKSNRQKKMPVHSKFLKSLKGRTKKDINIIANKLHEDVFKDLNCLDCANCCTSLPPIINETDIRRISKFLQMKIGTFTTTYIVADEDGDLVIDPTPCPFLGDDNKCAIYEVRPKSCKEYPHTGDLGFYKNLNLHAINAKYCPAVFHILEEMKKLYR